MGYTAPNAARATGYLVTAANWNELANDIIDLNARTTPGNANVANADTLTSTSYADLANVGPTVTITTGTLAIVILTCRLYNSVANAATFMGFAVSGATTLAASDIRALSHEPAVASTTTLRASGVYMVTLTAGANTFTAKYRVASGTGTFVDRWLIVIPANKLA